MATSSFDSAPMLFRADWLEETDDLVGVGVLRGLVENGMPSLHALALETVPYPMPRRRISPCPSTAMRMTTGSSFGIGPGAGRGRACVGVMVWKRGQGWSFCWCI